MNNNSIFHYHTPLNISKYFNGELYKKILAYLNKALVYKENDINKIRSDIAIEVINTIPQKTSNISSIEGPCGAGKTNWSLLTACKLIKENKTLNGIVYTSPFNAITDQNVETFKQYFNDVQTVNSTTIIENINYEDEENVLNEKVLNYSLNNYNFMATSHVHLFNILFGTSKANLTNLLFLTNKVIILDEIQAYNPTIWKCMINMLDKYSKLLNFEIIIMSATFPNFEKLSDNLTITNLIPNKRLYFSHPLFLNRVKFDYIGKIDSLEKIVKDESFYSNKKVLYEFITKKTANEFYDLIKSKFPNKEIYLLDGDVKPFERKHIINVAKKENKELIIISTQVIEAGVDLDFDIGFKDTSIPDSEIQFLGRINRSCLRDGQAYFFSYDSKKIYEKDVRFFYTIEKEEIQNAIRNNDNETLYAFTLKKLEEKSKQSNQKMNFNNFLNDCQSLMFDNIYKKMELIEPSANIYIAYKKEINKKHINENSLLKLIENIKEISFKYGIEVIDTKQDNDSEKIIIDGYRLWELFEVVSKDKCLSYDNKFLYKKDISVLKNYFTYVFYPNNSLPPYVEKISNNNYFTKYEKYIKDGKINRELLKEVCFL